MRFAAIRAAAQSRRVSSPPRPHVLAQPADADARLRATSRPSFSPSSIIIHIILVQTFDRYRRLFRSSSTPLHRLQHLHGPVNALRGQSRPARPHQAARLRAHVRPLSFARVQLAAWTPSRSSSSSSSRPYRSNVVPGSGWLWLPAPAAGRISPAAVSVSYFQPSGPFELLTSWTLC